MSCTKGCTGPCWSAHCDGAAQLGQRARVLVQVRQQRRVVEVVAPVAGGSGAVQTASRRPAKAAAYGMCTDYIVLEALLLDGVQCASASCVSEEKRLRALNYDRPPGSPLF